MPSGVLPDQGDRQHLTSADVIVDAANVVGSRPDGWWRDRAGAAARLVAGLGALPGRDVEVPGVGSCRVGLVVVVLEGQARDADTTAADPASVRVVRAAGSGDDAIVEQASTLAAAQAAVPVVAQATAGHSLVVVVTADRGLRARLPAGVVAVGPSWLRSLLEAGDRPAAGR